MVGKTNNSSSGCVRSELSIVVRRHSESVSEQDYSPTFPNTWKSFQHLGRRDSRRIKRYTVGCFSSPGFAGSSQLPSSEEIDHITAYLKEKGCSTSSSLASKQATNLPKRNRFSSGYILGLFMRRQNLEEQQEKRNPASSTSNVKRKIHKINSAPNISRAERKSTGISF